MFSEAEAGRAVEAYSDLILRLSYTYLHSTQDAEDICQTVLMKLLTRKQGFESTAHERAWVIRVAINACKSELRAFHRRSVPLEEAEQLPAPEAPKSEALAAVMGLPLKYRQAVYLFYYEGYSIREIAGMLGRSEAAVAAHLSRGRKLLKNTLGGSENECSEK